MDLIEQLRAQSSDAQTKASESNLSGDIQTLLKTVVFNKASDLHLVSRSEPQIRIDGTLRPLEFGVLSGKRYRKFMLRSNHRRPKERA